MVGCRAAPGEKQNVMRLETMIKRLVILLLLRTGFAAGQACLSGATINVDATVERQYLVSTNWAADQTSNIIGIGEFVDGEFLETSQLRQVSKAGDADCTFVISAPQGYHVKTAILAMGLEEARGFSCLYYIQMEGTYTDFPGPGDGRFCSSPTNGFAPDLLSASLQYTEGQYVNYLEPPFTSSGVRFSNDPLIQCSENRTMSVIYSNKDFNEDQKYIGFVMSFRLVVQYVSFVTYFIVAPPPFP